MGEIHVDDQFDQSSRNLDGLRFQEFFSAKIGFPPAFRSVLFFSGKEAARGNFFSRGDGLGRERRGQAAGAVGDPWGKLFVVSWTHLFRLTGCLYNFSSLKKKIFLKGLAEQHPTPWRGGNEEDERGKGFVSVRNR